ncbi:glutamyl aminopeptidase-like [Gigantopelta aegis]|uniref:glutamyl aminopeptidase-like n=1 Tax=Gigantopelta aegis TaxID=1735272 RepID=UPI001B88D580|nr:glutamyl aminopeptidase-like [Gigantopelta aegis]
MDFVDTSKVKINKRWMYLMVFLIVALPVIVGILVWYFVHTANCNSANITDKNTGNESANFSQKEPWKNLRLPRYIVPLHYDLTLYPDFYGNNGWFYGNETIEIDVRKDTKFILIHYKYMNITRTILNVNSTNAEIGIKRTFGYDPNEFWVVETNDVIKGGTVVKLDLQFDASLTRAIVGFYKSTYTNSLTGQKRNLVASKFEPVNARKAFPCFDEPNLKAEYTITLIHDASYTPLSNMPVSANQPQNWFHSLKSTTFQRSVKMSTYLVCFIVCDFQYKEDITSSGKQIRVYSTPDKLEQTTYALTILKHTMEQYENLFQLEYPLPKQDMIAIPDFVSGAMEHWGLITYRETAVLYNPREASDSNKQRVATVIAHEVAHQWFGNIVTMDWWDDLWLNEGFASFMEYVGVNSFEPQWQMLDQFPVVDQQPVMITDAGVQSHPIVVPVYKPTEINEVFDSISYSKGASVILMLESIMGKDKFFEGISKYLKRFQWGNAKTDDLWNALSEVPGAPDVKHIMDTWTRQMGFPFVDISFTSLGSGRTSVSARQKRYLADPSATFNTSDSEFGYKWYISLDYLSSVGSNGKQILDTSDATFEINFDMNDARKWIKFNINQTGFYRVLYPDAIWQRFSTILKTTDPDLWILSPSDRSGLIDDAFNLARGGIMGYDIALEMTSYLDRENNHIPWKSGYRGMQYISTMFEIGGDFGHWRKHVLNKVKPALDRIGWGDTGTHLQKLMRSNLISLACGHGDVQCMTNASMQFRSWLDNGAEIPPNLRLQVLPNMMFVFQTYLMYVEDESKVRSQDIWTVIRYISGNPAGQNLVWNWVRENWTKLVRRFTLFSRGLGRMVTGIVSSFNSEIKLQEVEEFFKKYPDAGSGARGRLQAIESIKRNINWMKTNEQTITDWLIKNT